MSRSVVTAESDKDADFCDTAVLFDALCDRHECRLFGDGSYRGRAHVRSANTGTLGSDHGKGYAMQRIGKHLGGHGRGSVLMISGRRADAGRLIPTKG
jgi:hypothetical protein